MQMVKIRSDIINILFSVTLRCSGALTALPAIFVSLIMVTTYGYSAAEEVPPLLVITSSGQAFDLAMEGLQDELEESFRISRMQYDSLLTIELLKKKIDSTAPRVIVLMGNKPIRTYKEYVARYRKGVNDIPVVTLIASQMESAIHGLTNIRGIAYETPMVTALIHYRNAIGTPINRVGVVYRSIYEPYIKLYTGFCKREKIEVVGSIISNDAKSQQKELKKALTHLIDTEHVDALWVLNDNMLLTPELILKTWKYAYADKKVPLIVGVEVLVDPRLNFGTFAVMPEPKATGEQAAQLITNLEDTDWKFDGAKVYPTISVYSVLNMKKAAEIPGIIKLNTNEVSKVLKADR